MPTGPTQDGTEPLILRRSRELRSSRGEERVSALEALADAYMDAGKTAKAVVCYQQAWDLGHRALAFQRKFAVTLSISGKPGEGLGILDEALKVRDDTAEHGRLQAARARVLWRQGKYDEAERAAGRARENLLSHGGTAGDLSECWHVQAVCRYSTSRYPEAAEAFAKARDLAREAGDLPKALHLEGNLGGVATSSGAYLEAVPLLERVLAAAEESNLHETAGVAQLNLGQIRRDLSLFDASLEAFKAAQKHFVAQGNALLTAVATLHMARLAAERADWHTARTMAERCLERFRSLGHRQREAQALIVIGRAALGSGDPDLSRKNAGAALAIADADRLREERGRALRVLGSSALAEDDVTEAARRFEESLVLFQGLRMAFEVAVGQVALAEALVRLHRDSDARRALALAAEYFGLVGAEQWRARCGK